MNNMKFVLYWIRFFIGILFSVNDFCESLVIFFFFDFEFILMCDWVENFFCF